MKERQVMDQRGAKVYDKITRGYDMEFQKKMMNPRYASANQRSQTNPRPRNNYAKNKNAFYGVPNVDKREK